MAEVNYYGAIVVGSGQGGGTLAGKFAASGMHTALIERKHLGGSHVNEGETRQHIPGAGEFLHLRSFRRVISRSELAVSISICCNR
jgi:choline dehydrogenase-like flavoprotein